MISFKLNPRTGCEIYRDDVLIEIVPVAGYAQRLEALGYVFPKAQRNLKRGARNGYGWSKSAGIRRGC